MLGDSECHKVCVLRRLELERIEAEDLADLQIGIGARARSVFIDVTSTELAPGTATIRQAES